MPACGDKVCGPDGCDGVCGECAANESCSDDGQCFCDPICDGKECGANGCGGECGTCEGDAVCNADFKCECTPQCEGKSCGDDGCGAICGTCADNEVCSEAGACECIPECGAAVCGDDGCGGSCGTCPFTEVCGDDGACTAQPVSELGSLCTTSDTCNGDSLDWPDCYNSQCNGGYCTSPYCTETCTLTLDKVDWEGNPLPDGVEDQGAVSDCGAGVGGVVAEGANYVCVNIITFDSGPVNWCLPGTTFKPCFSHEDCPAAESCQLMFIGGELSARCAHKFVEAAPVGTHCNGNPDAGDLSFCESDLCYGVGCSAYCFNESDCATNTLGCVEGKCGVDAAVDCETDQDCSAFECNENLQLDQAGTYFADICLGKSCSDSDDCPGDFYCRPFTNGAATVEEFDWDYSCSAIEPGSAGLGESCGDGTDEAPCAGICLNNGKCSSVCYEDADCEAADGFCALDEYALDVDGDLIDDKVLVLEYCTGFGGSKQVCGSDSDCTEAENEGCEFFEYQNEDGTLDAKALCQELPEDGAAPGEACGGSTEKTCGVGFCLYATDTTPGICSSVCENATDCPAVIKVAGVNGFDDGEYTGVCTTFTLADNKTLDNNLDNVLVPICTPAVLGSTGGSCADDFTSCPEGNVCGPVAIFSGTTGPGSVDFTCFANDAADTDPLGTTCNPATESCASGLCFGEAFEEICTALCNTDADCAADPTLGCGNFTLLERDNPEDNVLVQVCQKAESCLPCQVDDDCPGASFQCANIGGAGILAELRCAPSCTVDADCAGTDGGNLCLESIDAEGNPTGVTTCAPASCE